MSFLARIIANARLVLLSNSRKLYSRQQNYSGTWDNSCQKNTYLMQFYEKNISQVTIFKLYTLYNRDDKLR